MSRFPIQLQIISDLHLETPIVSPAYQTFSIDAQADNLCLLGDIGLVKDDGLFAFLRATLEKSGGSRIFYVIGNHELYQNSHELAVQRLRNFENEAKAEYGGRFVLLDKKRFDIDESTTILGCTLWSAISADQASEAQLRLTDFNEERGIRNWSLREQLLKHKQDVDWLDAQVQELQEKEPHRQIAILTHHSPTLDPRAVDPKHQNSVLSTCFATDLSSRPCWQSAMVKLWAFGHTHYNCAFIDDATQKIVVANQKGYQQMGSSGNRKIKIMLVEIDKNEWKIRKLPSRKAAPLSNSLVVDMENPEADFNADNNLIPVRQSHDTKGILNDDKIGKSIFRRAADRLHITKRTSTGFSG